MKNKKPSDFSGGFDIYNSMKLLESLKSLLLEHKLIHRFEYQNGDKFQTIDVEANPHSREGQGGYHLQRVPYDEILDSLQDIEPIVGKQINKILGWCDSYDKECAIIVRDNFLEFDYHMWIDKVRDDKIILTVNTSIRHPRKLFNPHKNNVIIIDEDGDHNIIESFTNTKINGKFIQYYLFD